MLSRLLPFSYVAVLSIASFESHMERYLVTMRYLEAGEAYRLAHTGILNFVSTPERRSRSVSNLLPAHASRFQAYSALLEPFKSAARAYAEFDLSRFPERPDERRQALVRLLASVDSHHLQSSVFVLTDMERRQALLGADFEMTRQLNEFQTALFTRTSLEDWTVTNEILEAAQQRLRDTVAACEAISNSPATNISEDEIRLWCERRVLYLKSAFVGLWSRIYSSIRDLAEPDLYAAADTAARSVAQEAAGDLGTPRVLVEAMEAVLNQASLVLKRNDAFSAALPALAELVPSLERLHATELSFASGDSESEEFFAARQACWVEQRRLVTRLFPLASALSLRTLAPAIAAIDGSHSSDVSDFNDSFEGLLFAVADTLSQHQVPRRSLETTRAVVETGLLWLRASMLAEEEATRPSEYLPRDIRKKRNRVIMVGYRRIDAIADVLWSKTKEARRGFATPLVMTPEIEQAMEAANEVSTRLTANVAARRATEAARSDFTLRREYRELQIATADTTLALLRLLA
jgi:hypothetical protein